MENFTIHIFGYGETQINSTDFSIKVKTDTLTKTTALIGASNDLALTLTAPSTAGVASTFRAVATVNLTEVAW